MNIFKDTSFNWWQIGLFKLSVFSIGLAGGAYLADFVLPYLLPLLGIGIISGLYITVVWCKQQ